MPGLSTGSRVRVPLSSRVPRGDVGPGASDAEGDRRGIRIAGAGDPGRSGFAIAVEFDRALKHGRGTLRPCPWSSDPGLAPSTRVYFRSGSRRKASVVGTPASGERALGRNRGYCFRQGPVAAQVSGDGDDDGTWRPWDAHLSFEVPWPAQSERGRNGRTPADPDGPRRRRAPARLRVLVAIPLTSVVSPVITTPFGGGCPIISPNGMTLCLLTAKTKVLR